MGRWYFGDIEGKFWSGVQCSCPMDKFGATDKAMFEYCCCSCSCEDDDDDYCSGCYGSKEEHLEAIHEDEPDVHDCVRDANTCSCEITKEDFEEKGLPFLQKHEELWKNKVETFELQSDGYDCCLVGQWKSDANDDELLKIADMCMLKQIQKFFEENDVDKCGWVAEH